MCSNASRSSSISASSRSSVSAAGRAGEAGADSSVPFVLSVSVASLSDSGSEKRYPLKCWLWRNRWQMIVRASFFSLFRASVSLLIAMTHCKALAACKSLLRSSRAVSAMPDAFFRSIASTASHSASTESSGSASFWSSPLSNSRC